MTGKSNHSKHQSLTSKVGVIQRGPCIIERGVCYTLDEFEQRTGIKEYAMRQARKKGLNVRYVGGRGFVIGDDWINFLQSQDAEKDIA